VSSPYPNEVSAAIEAVGDSPMKAFRIILKQLPGSIECFLSPRTAPLIVLQRFVELAVIVLGACGVVGLAPPSRQPYRFAVRQPRLFVALHVLLLGALWILQTDFLVYAMLEDYQFLAANVAIVACLVYMNRDGILWVLKWIGTRLRLCEADRPACTFAALSLALLIGSVLLLYNATDWRDCRVIGPHLLMSLLILAASPAWRFALGIAALHLAFTPAFLSEFEFHHRGRVVPGPEYIDLSRYLDYDSTAGPWGNTLLTPDSSTWHLLSVPPGIGMTMIYPNPDTNALHLPPRSRYVLISAEWAAAREGCHLELLDVTPVGNLYRNLDCPDLPPTQAAP
jgi:hypothetical protein